MSRANETICQVARDEMGCISELFSDWQETMIWSCLQGYMGEAYAAGFSGAGFSRPLSAAILIGDFCFFAGSPHRGLLGRGPKCHKGNFLILVPKDDGWAWLIEEVYGPGAEKITRFAIKKEPDAFEPERLTAYVAAIPDGFELKLIDRRIYEMAMAEEWSKDLCASFQDFLAFERCGLGVAAIHKGKLAAGAASYTVYDGGIEIEIDTKEEYRRRGLAQACGAKLILECLDRGLYPSWDAHDRRSLSLAEKLGYHLDHEYPAYIIDPAAV